MNKDNKPVLSEAEGLIPNYRFPEFKDDNFILTTLKDLGEFQRGISYKPEDVSNKGTLVLRSGNIQENKIDIRKDLVYVTKFIKPELLLKSNDIVICMSNGSKSLVGKSAEFIVNNTIGDVTVGAFCSFYRPKNEIVKYILQLPEFHKYVQLKLGGGNINNLKNTDLESFSALISSNPSEQKKIAACLSSLDDVIAGHEEKLTALEEHKKGLMQNLFPQEGETQPKYRFPEFKNDGDWVKKKLGEVFDLLSGFAFASEFFGDEGNPLITPKNFTSNGYPNFNIENTKFTTEKTENRFICSPGDILILLTDLTQSCELLGRPVVVKDEVLLNQRISKVILLIDIESKFLFYLLQTNKFRNIIINTATGTTVKHSSNSIILNTSLLFTLNKSEQQKIASVLSSVDELIVAQREKIEALKEHKKGLMQGVFPKIES